MNHSLLKHFPFDEQFTLMANFFSLLKITLGTSLVLQWLKICLPMQGMRVESLVRELRSHMPWGS